MHKNLKMKLSVQMKSPFRYSFKKAIKIPLTDSIFNGRSNSVHPEDGG